MSNKIKYPDCWAFFEEHARNQGDHYTVPKPDMSGDFLRHKRVEILFQILLQEFYKPNVKSASLYGTIQGITTRFAH